MKIRLYLIIIFFIHYTAETWSQSSGANMERDHAIGLTANSFSGYVLSYRYFGDSFGFQTNFFGRMNDEKRICCLGGSLMKGIRKTEDYRLFCHISSMYHYKMQKEHIYFPGSGLTYYVSAVEKRYYKNFSIGTGAGIELYIRNVVFTLWYGLGFYRNFTEFSMLGGGCSLLYSF